MATAPFEPRVVTNGYAVDPSSPLTPGQVDLVHRIVTSAGRFVSEGLMGAEYYRNWVTAAGTPGQYVEILGLVAMLTQVDTFHIVLGLPLRALPTPVRTDVRPSGQIDPAAGPFTGWTPTIRVSDASGLVAETYARCRPSNRAASAPPSDPGNIMKQLSAIPQDHAQFTSHAMVMYKRQRDVPGGVVSERQIELVAALVSKINDCSY
eukprot:m.88992 g.88992  ORF g.88992 m.88992 type:complete len:207 (+) comp20037_c0_seq2:684-1304(+)